MPEEGIQYLPKKELLTFEEIIRLVTVMSSMGISKVRFTGGEPFVRNDLMSLIARIKEIPGVKEWHITTNGILTAPYIKDLQKLGVGSVNLSLDTLDRDRFKLITRRDEYDACRNTLEQLLKKDIPVKVNMVVMEGKNIEDIVPMAMLAKDQNVSVRFIEEMPFNGSGVVHKSWTCPLILNYIQKQFPGLYKITDPENATAYHYKIPGFKGNLGIIAAFTRTFCGTCNRVRLTAQGLLKTCLYDDGVMNVKTLLRSGITDEALKIKLLSAFSSRLKDGFEAEQNRKRHGAMKESMSSIGG